MYNHLCQRRQKNGTTDDGYQDLYELSGKPGLKYPESIDIGESNRRIFKYERSTGILKVSRTLYSQGSVDEINREISQNPEGNFFDITGGSLLYIITLDNVKKVEFLSLEESVMDPSKPLIKSSEKDSNYERGLSRLVRKFRSYFVQ